MPISASPHEHQPLVAEPSTQQPAGQSDDGAGKQVQADQPAELTLVEARLPATSGPDRGNSLELESHRGAGEGERA
jgi:hypothetical protein